MCLEASKNLLRRRTVGVKLPVAGDEDRQARLFQAQQNPEMAGPPYHAWAYLSNWRFLRLVEQEAENEGKSNNDAANRNADRDCFQDGGRCLHAGGWHVLRMVGKYVTGAPPKEGYIEFPRPPWRLRLRCRSTWTDRPVFCRASNPAFHAGTNLDRRYLRVNGRVEYVAPLSSIRGA